MKNNHLQVSGNMTEGSGSTSMLTFDEACQYLKVSKSFLYKATSERTISFYKPTGGKMIRFKKEDLDLWLSQNRIASRSEIENQRNGKGGRK